MRNAYLPTNYEIKKTLLLQGYLKRAFNEDPAYLFQSDIGLDIKNTLMSMEPYRDVPKLTFNRGILDRLEHGRVDSVHAYHNKVATRIEEEIYRITSAQETSAGMVIEMPTWHLLSTCNPVLEQMSHQILAHAYYTLFNQIEQRHKQPKRFENFLWNGITIISNCDRVHQ